LPQLDIGWLASMGLLTLRLGAFAVMTPPIGASTVPAIVRAAFMVTLAAAFAGTVAPVETSLPSLPILAAAAVREVALGAVMALGLNIAFAIFNFGARLLDVQIGFGIGQVLDPMTKQPVPILGAAFGQLALVTFFAIDGHHALMRGVAISVERFPPRADWLMTLSLAAVVRPVSELFSLGFTMVAPIVLCLLLAELGLGVIARSLPQINVLALGLPVKIITGLVALSLWASGAGSVIGRAHASAFSAWEALWR
jgi:flagellar biosynthesis protein FliR